MKVRNDNTIFYELFPKHLYTLAGVIPYDRWFSFENKADQNGNLTEVLSADKTPHLIL